MIDLKQGIWTWYFSGTLFLWDFGSIREIVACPENQIAVLKEVRAYFDVVRVPISMWNELYDKYIEATLFKHCEQNTEQNSEV